MPDPERVAYITQTTLSVDETVEIIAALRERFPAIVGPKKDDICYATQNRQNAVKELAAEVDLVLVIGSRNSSNSNRLVDVTRELGVPAHLIDDETAIDPAWLEGVETVGITSGASAPESLVERVVAHFRALGVRAGRVARAGERERALLAAARAAPRSRPLRGLASGDSARVPLRQQLRLALPRHPEPGPARGAGRAAMPGERVGDGLVERPEAQAGVDRRRRVDVVHPLQLGVAAQPQRQVGPGLDARARSASASSAHTELGVRAADPTAAASSSPSSSGRAGPTRVEDAGRPPLGHVQQPGRQVAHVDHLRLRLRPPRRQHAAALGHPRRPVREAVGGIVGADDQPRPDHQRAPRQRPLAPPARTAPSAARSSPR